MENLDALSGLIDLCAASTTRDALLAGFPIHAGALLQFERCALLEEGEGGSGLACLWGDAHSLSLLEHELAGDVLRTGQARLEAADLTLSVIGAPLLAGDRVLGALTFATGRPGGYQAGDTGTAVLLAGLLAQALERLRLAERLEKANREVERLGSFPDLNPAAIIEMDETGALFYANPAARRMFTNLEDECTRSPLLADLPAMIAKLRAAGSQEVIREVNDGEAWFQQVLQLVVSTGRLRSFIIDITQQKQASQEVLRHSQYLEALHETTLGLVRRLDLEDLLEALITRVGQLLNTKHGFIFLLDPDGIEIEQRVGTGLFTSTVGLRMKRGEGISGQVWESGRPMLVEDYGNWENRLAAYANLKVITLAAVPLKSGDLFFGTIGIAYRSGEHAPFGETEMSVLTRFAELASLALDNARLFYETQTHARRLELLTEMGRKMSLAGGDQAIMEVASRLTPEMVPAEHVCVAILTESGESLKICTIHDESGNAHGRRDHPAAGHPAGPGGSREPPCSPDRPDANQHPAGCGAAGQLGLPGRHGRADYHCRPDDRHGEHCQLQERRVYEA